MIVFIVMLSIIACYKVHISSFNNDYITKEQCNSIKGFFIALVFLSHIRPYIDDFLLDGGIGYDYYKRILAVFGQLMVTMFLFYSGYGVWYSHLKNERYLDTFVKKRIIITLSHFWLALFFYVIVNIMCKIYYPIKIYIGSLIAWESIGNSNWYIFDILLLYAITFLALKTGRKYHLSENKKLIVLLIITMLSAIIMRLLGKNAIWYNTILCYPTGALFAVHRHKIETVLRKPGYYVIALLTNLVTFCVAYLNSDTIIGHLLMHILFSTVVVLFSMRVVIGNQILSLLGRYLFHIYIMQRIPMILFARVSISNACLYTCICIAVTGFLCYVFGLLCRTIDAVLLA